jgi:hypothetical protein
MPPLPSGWSSLNGRSQKQTSPVRADFPHLPEPGLAFVVDYSYSTHFRAALRTSGSVRSIAGTIPCAQRPDPYGRFAWAFNETRGGYNPRPFRTERSR